MSITKIIQITVRTMCEYDYATCITMAGWLAANNGYFWYGNSPDSPYIYAEFQSGGLVVTGCVNDVLWIGWIIKFCAKLLIALQREVYDAGILGSGHNEK